MESFCDAYEFAVMDVCVRLFYVCAVLCAGSSLPTGWSPVQGVLLCKRSRNGQGPTKGCRAIDGKVILLKFYKNICDLCRMCMIGEKVVEWLKVSREHKTRARNWKFLRSDLQVCCCHIWLIAERWSKMPKYWEHFARFQFTSSLLARVVSWFPPPRSCSMARPAPGAR
jgi:hypothetical protein